MKCKTSFWLFIFFSHTNNLIYIQFCEIVLLFTLNKHNILKSVKKVVSKLYLFLQENKVFYGKVCFRL